MILTAFLIAVNAAVIAWSARSYPERFGPGIPHPLIIALLTAAGAAATFRAADPAAVPMIMLGSVSALIDARRSRLPLELTTAMLLQVIALSVTVADVAWTPVLLSTGMWVLPLLAGALTRQVGWGDVLFAIPLGLWAGSVTLQVSLGGLGIALVASAIWSFWTHLRGRHRIPFGPFLWTGALIIWLPAVP